MKTKNSDNIKIFNDLGKVSKERDTLDGFTETHLIGQDSVDTLVIEIGQPIHSLHSQ